jgi:antitoxin component YwqK of YwqJK toxin-antitoxin module
MERVPYSELDYPGDDGLYYHEGAPFTGVAYQMAKGGWLESEVEYRDGLANGPGKSWFPSRSLAAECRTAGGVYHGLRRQWHENGRSAAEEMYEHGICLWRRRWDAEGNQIEDFRLKETDRDFGALQMFRKHSAGQGWEAKKQE